MASVSARPFRFAVQAFEARTGKEWIEVARRAEDLGYSTLFTTDHYFGPGSIADSSGHRPVDVAPIAAMTAAAVSTTALRVGCRVFNVDLHQPVVLAKEMATVDLLSDGRVEVGLGAGWVAAEYEGLGVAMDPPGVRISRLAEVVGLMRAHWSGEDVAVDGTHVPRTASPDCPGRCSSRTRRSSSAVGASASSPSPGGSPTSSASTSTTPPAVSARRAWPARVRARRHRSWRGCAPAPAIGSTTSSSRSAPTSSPSTTTPGRWSMRWRAASGSAPRSSPPTRTRCSGAWTSICATLQERRERYGFSYLTIPQRNLDDFAPVVARLSGT